MHVRQVREYRGSCTLVYSGVHLAIWDSSSESDLILVLRLRSKLSKSRAQKCTPISKEHLSDECRSLECSFHFSSVNSLYFSRRTR